MVEFGAVTDLDRPFDPDPLEDGARVRIRLSGECPGSGNPRRLHIEAHNGRAGRIAEGVHRILTRACTHAPGHPYLVGVEIPLAAPHQGTILLMDHYARIELERLP